jgi:hypothetical protein
MKISDSIEKSGNFDYFPRDILEIRKKIWLISNI